MRKLIETALPAAAVLALLAVPSAVMGQEPEEEQQQEQVEEVQEQCTVEVTPSEFETGKTAVRITATFSSDIGVVQKLNAPEASGIALASPEDLAIVADMARSETEEGEEAEAPRPIVMVADGNQATIWLNTEEAEPGTHSVTLKGEKGDCTVDVIVAEQGDESN